MNIDTTCLKTHHTLDMVTNACNASTWAIPASLVEDSLFYIPPFFWWEKLSSLSEVKGYVLFLVLGLFMYLVHFSTGQMVLSCMHRPVVNLDVIRQQLSTLAWSLLSG